MACSPWQRLLLVWCIKPTRKQRKRRKTSAFVSVVHTGWAVRSVATFCWLWFGSSYVTLILLGSCKSGRIGMPCRQHGGTPKSDLMGHPVQCWPAFLIRMVYRYKNTYIRNSPYILIPELFIPCAMHSFISSFHLLKIGTIHLVVHCSWRRSTRTCLRHCSMTCSTTPTTAARGTSSWWRPRRSDTSTPTTASPTTRVSALYPGFAGFVPSGRAAVFPECVRVW